MPLDSADQIQYNISTSDTTFAMCNSAHKKFEVEKCKDSAYRRVGSFR